MKKTSILFVMLSVIFTIAAAEKNLVLNGTFKMDGKSFPPFWTFRSHTPSTVDGFPDGGPNGLGFLRIHGRKALISVIQSNITIIKGEKYRISAYVRTKNLTGKRNCVAIHPGAVNSGLVFPANQPEWKYIEKIHTGYATGDGFQFAIEVETEDGVLDIADLKIVPLGKEGIAKSRTQIQNVSQGLIPLNLLEHINLNKPELSFFWVGRLPGDPAKMRCRFSLNGKSITVPFSTKTFNVNLKKLNPQEGKNNLKLTIIDNNGKSLFTGSYPVAFTDLPEAKEEPKRLNNLVRVIFEGSIAANGKKTFITSQNHWVLFRYTGDSKPELKINGQTVLAQDFPNNSGVRYLNAGEYTLKNTGDACGVSIRLIPDIHMFPLWHTRIPGNGSYDWDFAKKYMLPALTTINVGGVGEVEKKELVRFGLKFLDNASAIDFKTTEKLLERFNTNKALQDDLHDGITMDEVEYAFSGKVLSPYAKGLRLYPNPKNKEIRTWVIGPPSHSFVDFISAIANVSGGRGQLLSEVYNRAQYTEEDAANYIRQTAQHTAFYKDITPALFNNVSVILGNFSLAPLISLDSIPSADYRYYLDMQMNLLANDPKLDGLGGVGFWGSQNCDEEILRWCFALLKHYAIEGNTTMLSEKYGYTYNLKYIQNPDFEDGLKNWDISGKVEAGHKKDFGGKYERRYGSVYPQGDTFAVLTGNAAEPAVLRQKITGLTPGKLYSVYYMVTDYDDVLKEKFNPQRIPVTLTIPGGVIVRRSYYIENRAAGKYLPVATNCCKYVFRAKGTEAELVFSNKKAPDGSRQTLNYITVREYFNR